jgi:hypothetical protein
MTMAVTVTGTVTVCLTVTLTESITVIVTLTEFIRDCEPKEWTHLVHAPTWRLETCASVAHSGPELTSMV